MEEQKDEELPSNVYLFLNEEGQLREMVLKEDWTKGEGQQKNIAFQHYVLGVNDAFLGELTGGSRFSYAVGGTGNGAFPIQGKNGGLNIKIREQGFNTQFLSKPSSEDGSGSATVDVWKETESNLLVLGEKENSAHVLLWNGEEFQATKPLVKNQGGGLVLNDLIWNYLGALKTVDTNAGCIPQKVFLSFATSDRRGERSSERVAFPLKDVDRVRLSIPLVGGDFRTVREQVKQIEGNLNGYKEIVACLEWRIMDLQMKLRLERMGIDYIARDFTTSTFPRIFDYKPVNKDDFRQEVISFLEVLAEGIPDVLRKDKRINVNDIDSQLREIFKWRAFVYGVRGKFIDGEQLESPWGGLQKRVTPKISSGDFVELMEQYPEYLEKVSKKILLPEDRDKIRKVVENFTQQWKEQICGSRGRFLWDFPTESEKWRNEIAQQTTVGKYAGLDEKNAIKWRKTFLDRKNNAEESLSEAKRRLKNLGQSQGGKILPGIYQLMLVFDGVTQGAEDRERPFIIWTSSNKRGL